jgi:hypothetical protein
MQSFNKLSREVSFWFLEAKFSCQLGGMSRSAESRLLAHIEPGASEPSLIIEGLKATNQSMRPHVGGIEHMNRVAARVAKEELDRLRESDQRSSIDLWNWVQHEITISTTESVYGPANPYRSNEVEEGFW